MLEQDIPPSKKKAVMQLLTEAEYLLFQVRFILAKLDEKEKRADKKQTKIL